MYKYIYIYVSFIRGARGGKLMYNDEEKDLFLISAGMWLFFIFYFFFPPLSPLFLFFFF